MIEDRLVITATILDALLVFMTAAWILFGVYKGLTTLEIVYNYVYVIMNISTLIINLILIHKKREMVN